MSPLLTPLLGTRVWVALAGQPIAQHKLDRLRHVESCEVLRSDPQSLQHVPRNIQKAWTQCR